jgi:L-lactate dehydrogenase (cytochrome)
MRIGEIRQLVQMKPAELNGTRRRLAASHDVDDLRSVARRLIPRPVFDYVDGAADEELAVRANRAAFRQWRFRPRLLVDVGAVDPTATVLGRQQPLPLALGPTGYTRMMHQAGESAVARSAHRHGLAYTLSTMGTTSIEDVGRVVPDKSGLWFQLYIHRDETVNKDLVSRAEAAGYQALMVTLDTVVPGHRIRDVHNGLVIPPALTAKTLASIAVRPSYWTRMLRGPALEFANLPSQDDVSTVASSVSKFDPSITWATIEALRDRWPRSLLVKGPLGPDDAVRAFAAGVDGIVLSNHGGRQLDRTIPPVDLLPSVREAVGPRATVLVDSGIRHGADIAVAVALGADAAVIGRAYLYGLMAGGELGVDRVLDLLGEQYTRTLQLLGVQSTAELRATGRDRIARD